MWGYICIKALSQLTSLWNDNAVRNFYSEREKTRMLWWIVNTIKNIVPRWISTLIKLHIYVIALFIDTLCQFWSSLVSMPLRIRIHTNTISDQDRHIHYPALAIKAMGEGCILMAIQAADPSILSVAHTVICCNSKAARAKASSFASRDIIFFIHIGKSGNNYLYFILWSLLER